MKAFNLKLSDLMETARWDVQFHEIREAHKERASQIETKRSRKDVVADLKALPKDVTRHLRVFSRHERPSDEDGLNAAIKDYPFLAWAMIESRLEDLIADRVRKQEEIEREIGDLRKFGEKADNADQ